MNPLCQNCVYFIPGLYKNDGFCKREVIYRGRGKLLYNFAMNMRTEESKCGPTGRLFLPKKTTMSHQTPSQPESSPDTSE